MLSEARRLGARTVRFLTNVGNAPVHRNAFRHGFSMRFVVRHWKYEVSAHGETDMGGDAYRLRLPSPAEAPALYDWWTRSSSWQATEGLVNRHWSFGTTSARQWIEAAEPGELLVPVHIDTTALALPPPLVLFETEDEDPKTGVEMLVAAVSAAGAEWLPMASGLAAYAREQGVSLISGLLPDLGLVRSGFEGAGFVADPDEDCLTVFELRTRVLRTED